MLENIIAELCSNIYGNKYLTISLRRLRAITKHTIAL